ncbi:hypothetical protein [Acinetobacter sp. ANC 4779]|uniref:hypothetical protein n=1 Tax=Acinetobacter sp. ANC 4779 TaxID=2529848 RepID=UPI00148E9880|nr:hypothetical protein [Acinetobacter sp. ANC 4779]
MAINNMTYKPLNCDDMDRAIQLCKGVEFLIDEFKRDINCKESGELFEVAYQAQLLQIADHLEELIYRLTYLAGKNYKHYFFCNLHGIIKSLSSAPNVLIITAYHLAPQRPFKRLLNKNTFDYELNLILKKVSFTRPVLQQLWKGRKTITRGNIANYMNSPKYYGLKKEP